MKLLIICCMAACMLACNRPMQSTSTPVIVNGNAMLLGKILPDQLNQPPFDEWYKKEYAAYIPDAANTDTLKTLIHPYKLEIFLGTWCGDTKREVPKLMKLLNALQVKPSNITIIAVGNNDTLYKQSPGHEEKGKAIYRVPHLNIYKNGKEIGRITETPVKTWEKDLLTIIRKQQYTPTHGALLSAAKLIEEQLQKNAEVKAEELVTSMRSVSLHSAQLLNSYGYVKLYSNEPKPAYLAFKLNTILFPDAWYTYSAMATYFRLQHNEEEEKIWLQQVLQKKPDDEPTKKRLAVLK